ncbi:MAG: O-antigen ligase family protein [Bacillota bacterium]|nr:O-antigen ligase family protein [Bacillota bacterium]
MNTDRLIIALMGIYIFFLPFVHSQKTEWMLSCTIFFIIAIYGYELIRNRECRQDFAANIKRIVREPFTILFFILVASMVLSSLYAYNRNTALKESIRYVFYFGLYCIIRMRIKEVKYYKYLISISMLSAFFVAVLGIIEFFNIYKTGLTIMQTLLMSRVKGPMPHPNTLAAYMILIIFPVIVISMNLKGKLRIPFIILDLMLVFNLAVTYSRNGWIAFLIGVLLLAVLYNWKWIFLYIVPLIYLPFNPVIFQRIKQLDDNSINEGRLRLWKMALKVIKDHFPLGVGNGNFVQVYDHYTQLYPNLTVNEPGPLPPHNTYLKIFSEVGIIGVAAFAGMCIDIIRKAYMVKNKCEGYVKYFYSGFFVSIICFIIMNCFDDLMFIPKASTYFFIFISMMYAMNSQSEE